ncbi:MAG: adenylosuccinate synthetase, partial [Methanosarcinaceae archaeon]|nr:adenylosuccinate synthetase [Methanosarcinaceae archaeon]
MGDLCGDEARFRAKAEDIFRKKAEIIKAAGIDPATVLNDDVFERLCEAGRKLRDHMTDASLEINRALAEGKNVLAEGAQGSHLDVIHGTQKYVTSSSTVAGSACTGLGVGPMKVTGVIGIVKAYITRVGEGPLPTELKDETGDRMAEVGGEYGTTTGRKRRCGWFDLPLLLKAVNLNGYSEIALTKIDVLTGLDPIKVCVAYDCNGEKMSYPPLDTAALAACRPVYEELPGWKEDLTGIRSYEDLPENAKAYIKYLEDRIGVPIRYISVGPGREQTFLNPAHE